MPASDSTRLEVDANVGEDAEAEVNLILELGAFDPGKLTVSAHLNVGCGSRVTEEVRPAEVGINSNRHLVHHERHGSANAERRDLKFVGRELVAEGSIGNGVSFNVSKRDADVRGYLGCADFEVIGTREEALHDGGAFAVSRGRAVHQANRVAIFIGVDRTVGKRDVAVVRTIERPVALPVLSPVMVPRAFVGNEFFVHGIGFCCVGRPVSNLDAGIGTERVVDHAAAAIVALVDGVSEGGPGIQEIAGIKERTVVCIVRAARVARDDIGTLGNTVEFIAITAGADRTENVRAVESVDVERPVAHDVILIGLGVLALELRQSTLWVAIARGGVFARHMGGMRNGCQQGPGVSVEERRSP